MSRPARLSILLLALTLSFTLQSLPSGESSARAAAVATACTGVAGCKLVASVDVDGDGRADQVGIATRKLDDNGSIIVRVRTAKGHLLQTTGRGVYWFDHPFLGAVPLDGRAGAEIVVGSTMGANEQEFRVITYRSGKLVTEKAPPAVWTKKGLAAATTRWAIDGSYSFNRGVRRTVSRTGVVSLTLTTSERRASGHGFNGHATTYVWRSGHWVKKSTKKVHYTSDAAAFATSGWHVAGLPRFR